jgi:small subunit ribosomal protein S20
VANIKSQKERIKTNRIANERNNSIRTSVKNAVKKFNAAVAAGDLALAEKLFPETVAIINKAKTDGVLHINTASRKVATISRS